MLFSVGGGVWSTRLLHEIRFIGESFLGAGGSQNCSNTFSSCAAVPWLSMRRKTPHTAPLVKHGWRCPYISDFFIDQPVTNLWLQNCFTMKCILRHPYLRKIFFKNAFNKLLSFTLYLNNVARSLCRFCLSMVHWLWFLNLWCHSALWALKSRPHHPTLDHLACQK